MPDFREFSQPSILAFGGKLRRILTVHQRVTDAERCPVSEDRSLLSESNRPAQGAIEASKHARRSPSRPRDSWAHAQPRSITRPQRSTRTAERGQLVRDLDVRAEITSNGWFTPPGATTGDPPSAVSARSTSRSTSRCGPVTSRRYRASPPTRFRLASGTRHALPSRSFMMVPLTRATLVRIPR